MLSRGAGNFAAGFRNSVAGVGNSVAGVGFCEGKRGRVQGWRRLGFIPLRLATFSSIERWRKS